MSLNTHQDKKEMDKLKQKKKQKQKKTFHLSEAEQQPAALSKEQTRMRRKGRKIQMEKAQRM